MREPLCRPEAWNFIKKEILAQVFSYEFYEISKRPFFIEHLRWLLLLITFTHLLIVMLTFTSCTMIICNSCIIFKTKLNITDIFVEIVVFVLFIKKGQLIGVFENPFVCF